MKKLSKKAGITIFTIAMVILGAIIVLYHNPLADPADELMKKGIACGLIAAAIIAFIALYDKITVLPKELYQNRRLIWKLAKSDFKKRYAGSYMGAFWAMVQPVITVAMYYGIRRGAGCPFCALSDRRAGSLVLFFGSPYQRHDRPVRV